ncbi:hypothetical protein MKW92_006306 [Papaver armeniacum]|nr:hypothetical protein MKW92_006306 [Papaver armeniacum]
MKARFLPFDYAQKLFQSYQQCSQNRRPIDEYTEEFYRLGSRVNLPETEAQQVSRYLSGLDPEFKEVLYLHPISTVTESVSLAHKIDLQAKPPPPSPRVPTVDASAVKKGNNPYAKPMRDICYRCRLSGHHSNECPKRRQTSLVDGGDSKSTEHMVSKEDEVIEQVYADDLGGKCSGGEEGAAM